MINVSLKNRYSWKYYENLPDIDRLNESLKDSLVKSYNYSDNKINLYINFEIK